MTERVSYDPVYLELSPHRHYYNGLTLVKINFSQDAAQQVERWKKYIHIQVYTKKYPSTKNTRLLLWKMKHAMTSGRWFASHVTPSVSIWWGRTSSYGFGYMSSFSDPFFTFFTALHCTCTEINIHTYTYIMSLPNSMSESTLVPLRNVMYNKMCS